MSDLSHIDNSALPKMVDVSQKAVSERSATASGNISLPAGLIEKFENGDLVTAKGSVIQTAIIAGTLAVKKCPELIPFCHPLPIEKISFEHEFNGEGQLSISCSVKATYKTGVEMEALMGVSQALLTIYDMCKSAGQDMEISDIRVIKKTGGKKDFEK